MLLSWVVWINNSPFISLHIYSFVCQFVNMLRWLNSLLKAAHKSYHNKVEPAKILRWTKIFVLLSFFLFTDLFLLKVTIYSGTVASLYSLALNDVFLCVGTYVLVITSRQTVGSFLGFPVYRLMSMRLLACNEALRFSDAQEVRFCMVRSYSGIIQMVDISSL